MELVDEFVDVLLVGRRQRSPDDDAHVAVREGMYGFPDRPCVPEAIRNDIIDWALSSLQNEPQPATHEGQDGSVGRSVAFGVDDQSSLSIGEIPDGLQQPRNFGLRRPRLLRHEGEPAELCERGDARDSVAISFARGNHRLRSPGGVDRDGDVEQRLVVHHQQAALSGCRTVRRYPNAAEHAGDRERDFREEAQPTPYYGSAFDWKQPDRRPDDQTLSEIEYRKRENTVDEKENAAT